MAGMDEEVRMPPSFVKYFSLLMLFAGLLFYALWVTNDPTTWNDIGVIVVTLIFLAFGTGGFFLGYAKEKGQ